MPRYLIVANQTLGGDVLDRTVDERIARGGSAFHIVVPMTAARHETSVWTRGFHLGDDLVLTPAQAEQARQAMEEEQQRREAERAEARARAESRLHQMMEKIVSAGGGEPEGEVGDPDPLVAVRAVLERRSFDEIIVSTLPAGISRWLRMDLPSQIGRMTETPVTTVVAEEN